MHDWRNEVSRRLETSKLSEADRREIARELVGYLDDLCAEGGDESPHDAANVIPRDSDAIARASAELDEDPDLAAQLFRARKEGPMNDRTKHLWLPGAAVLLASALALALLQFAGFSPYFPRAWGGNAGTELFLRDSLMIYVPWLCVLPFLGAAGAYWSRRTGGGPALRIAVGIFPAIVFLGTFLVFVPLSVAIDALPPARIFLPAFAGLILSWVVIPGAALLLGVLPFLRGSRAAERTPA